jgi:hypothetical protein
MSRADLRVLAVFGALGYAGSARAGGDTTVDWATGVVTARGIGIADRHAPSPAAAREPARRAAEDQARKRLAAALAGLPLASGGTVGTRDGARDPATKSRLDQAVAAALVASSEPETDGSWQVTLALPIEAVRLALAGPRVVAGDDNGPPIVIVDGVKAEPAIGWTIGGAACPTLWVSEIPAWAKDAPHVKAKSAARGAIAIDGTGSPSTLYVIRR